MNNLSNFFKERAKKNDDFFFGENNRQKLSNKYFTFNGVLSDDEIIINTKNIRAVRDSFVLVVAENKAVFLKDWQVRPIHQFIGGMVINSYLIKLNRKFFKVYEFKNSFDDFVGMKEDDFDTLLECAKEQTEKMNYVANGHSEVGA